MKTMICGEKDPKGKTDTQDPILENGIGSPDGVTERLREVIGKRTLKEVSALWGVPLSTIGNMLKRGTAPSLALSCKISQLENVDLLWLATGKGGMYIQANNAGLSTPPELDSNFVMVNDLSGVEAAAGGGTYVTEEEMVGRMAFRREWIAREGLNTQALRIIRARGDSMEPTIQDGAPILVEAFAYQDNDGNIRHLHSGTSPCDMVKRDGVYVVRLDDRLLVKRLQLDMLGGLLVKSDNSTYDTLHVPADRLDDIAVVGRVVWTGRKL